MTEDKVEEAKPSRSERRRQVKNFKKMMVDSKSATQMYHPMTNKLTRAGKRRISERRAKAKAAKVARKRNR